MAFFKNLDYLTQRDGPDFDQLYEPGDRTPHSGIYRCVGCGCEVVSTQDEPLPPQNHHQHDTRLGHIHWKLIVAAAHD